jgi:hypothetical protein
MGDLERDLLLDLGGHLVGGLFPLLQAMGFSSFALHTATTNSDMKTGRDDAWREHSRLPKNRYPSFD